jgi:hypothetical protein
MRKGCDLRRIPIVPSRTVLIAAAGYCQLDSEPAFRPSYRLVRRPAPAAAIASTTRFNIRHAIHPMTRDPSYERNRANCCSRSRQWRSCQQELIKIPNPCTLELDLEIADYWHRTTIRPLNGTIGDRRLSCRRGPVGRIRAGQSLSKRRAGLHIAVAVSNHVTRGVERVRLPVRRSRQVPCVQLSLGERPWNAIHAKQDHSPIAVRR